MRKPFTLTVRRKHHALAVAASKRGRSVVRNCVMAQAVKERFPARRRSISCSMFSAFLGRKPESFWRFDEAGIKLVAAFDCDRDKALAMLPLKVVLTPYTTHPNARP